MSLIKDSMFFSFSRFSIVLPGCYWVPGIELAISQKLLKERASVALLD